MVTPRTTVAELEATSGDDRVEMAPSSDGSSCIAAPIAFLLGLHVRPRKLGRI